MVVPAGTPKPIIDRIGRSIAKVVDGPEMKARFGKQGVELKSSTAQELADLMRAEDKRWSTLIREKGLKAE